jgi:FkbH-like protein
MKLAEALRLTNARPAQAGDPFRVWLACSFTPLHVATFVSAHLTQRLKHRPVALSTGIYGDLIENLAKAARDAPHAAAVVLDWTDLDPRLGYRRCNGWRQEHEADILQTVTFRLAQLSESLAALARHTPVALALPSLPLPFRFKGPTTWGDPVAFALWEKVHGFAAALAGTPMIAVISPQKLDMRSPWDRRLDLNSLFRSGFPYHLEHASVLGELLAELIHPSPPKKGIITDLDDTLWGGILGENGVDGVSWNLEQHTQGHALYQQTLASLSDLGVLIGVATKNDPALVQKALCREDLLVPHEALYPIQAGWGSKSASVGEVLRAWNIAADSVVFVDDSRWEIAEVQAAYPDMECLAFPAGDDPAVYQLIEGLRDRFGKPFVTAEDRLRSASLRKAPPGGGLDRTSVDEFLAQAEATLVLRYNQPDQRAFELINKTNQFNLNGRRIDPSAWQRRCESADSLLVTVAYQDKFGPLGTISVLAGRRQQQRLVVDTWVLSCRAFSRRIEYQLLEALFALEGIDAIDFDFVPTPRNALTGEFLATLTATPPTGTTLVTRADFLARRPSLFAKVITQQ